MRVSFDIRASILRDRPGAVTSRRCERERRSDRASSTRVLTRQERGAEDEVPRGRQAPSPELHAFDPPRIVALTIRSFRAGHLLGARPAQGARFAPIQEAEAVVRWRERASRSASAAVRPRPRLGRDRTRRAEIWDDLDRWAPRVRRAPTTGSRARPRQEQATWSCWPTPPPPDHRDAAVDRFLDDTVVRKRSLKHPLYATSV
jgi:hypothetical protein